jgi:hypothetical protein
VKFKIKSGSLEKIIDSKDKNEALYKFFNNYMNVEKIGAVFSIIKIENGDEEINSQFGATEVALQKLGLYSKYRDKITEARKNNKKSKKFF